MAVRRKQFDKDGNAFNYGSKVRVERGLAHHRDDPVRWYVYRLIDVSDDENTTLTERWDEVASYVETEAGVMPDKVEAKAQSLAAKQE